MISTYFVRASLLAFGIVLFSSCLNSSNNSDVELSKDAQIYSFSLSSKADTTQALTASPFTIDQIGNKIFNQNPLPYQFSVDSAKLTLSGYAGTIANSFARVNLVLANADSTYTWNGNDSVAINRLHQIVVTAANGEASKTYTFELNTHQTDPYALTWEKIAANYLTPLPVGSQRTISFGGRFITYYTSGTNIRAMSAPAAEGKNWVSGALTGLPATIRLSSMVVVGSNAFALNSDNSLYKTTDGLNWTKVSTGYPIIAVYGKLPSATGGDILAVINNNGTATFAETNDFSSFRLMNAAPEKLPVSDFSVTQINNPAVYSAKYILLSGGKSADNANNNSTWLLEEKDNAITHISKAASFSLAGSTVFNYDNIQYMITAASAGNILLRSENYGINWTKVAENQELPEEFTNRANASVITDSDNYIWIFGGTSGTQTQLVDVWRGRLNRLASE